MKIEDFLGIYKSRLALSPCEVAKSLGVSPITVDRLTRRGLLHPSRITCKPLDAAWEIERFLRETTSREDRRCIN